ncbi:DNA polymerase [Shigella flexneri]
MRNEEPAYSPGFSLREDYLIVSADYSQIELRIMAHLSRETGPADGICRREGHPPGYRCRSVWAAAESVTNEQRRSAKAESTSV